MHAGSPLSLSPGRTHTQVVSSVIQRQDTNCTLDIIVIVFRLV